MTVLYVDPPPKLLASEVPKALICPPFTASVEAAKSDPAATLVIFKLPALMPVASTLGPPVMVRPLVLSVALPVVTLVKLGLSAI